MQIIRLYQQLYDAAPITAPSSSDVPSRVFVPAQSPGTLRGIATNYSKLSVDMGGYQLRILPGAFTKSLKSKATFACWMHDNDELFASTNNRTLRFTDTQSALHCEIDCAPTGRGFDTYTLVAGKYLGEMSVGIGLEGVKFVTEKNAKGEKISIEEVSQARLYEISVVVAGAMPGTRIEAINTGTPTRQSKPVSDLQRAKARIRRYDSLASSGAPMSRAARAADRRRV